MSKFKQLICGRLSGIHLFSDKFHVALTKFRHPSFKHHGESDSLKAKLLSKTALAFIALFAFLQPFSVQNAEALDNITTTLGWRTANNGAENHGADIIPFTNSTKGFNSWDRNQRYRIGSIIFHGVGSVGGWTEIREKGSNGIVHNGFAESYPANIADTKVTINQFPFNYGNSQLIANLKYGKWYLSPKQFNTTSSCPNDSACYFFAFEPNITEINRLKYGQTITVSIRQQFQWLEGNQRKTANPEWKTISLTIKAADLDLSWNGHDTKIIELDGVPGNEIHGTVNELNYPWSGIWYVRRNVYEIKTGERSRQADHAEAGPCQNETSDVFRYGTNFRLGTWYFAADGKKFCFKPKSDALDHLVPGEILESGMALSVKHYQAGILTSDQVTVRLRKPGIVLNIENTSISNTNSAQYNKLEGTANVVHTLNNNSTVEVSAIGPVNGTPVTRTPVASNLNVGYPSQAIGLDFDYGTWYWSDAEDKFEFRPNTNAINNLVGNNTVETKLIVKLMQGGQQIGETKEIAVTISGRVLPELSIRAKENQGTVNEAASATATYTITSTIQPTNDMIESVKLEASSNGGSSFLEGGVSTLTLTPDLDFSSATQTPYEVEYSVDIEDDDIDEADGEILLTIQSGTNYSVGSSNSATVSVADNDVPEISIVGNTVTEGTGDSAVFTVSSSIERQGIDLEINYSASQGIHDYINPALLGNTSVTLAQGDTSVTALISFPIIDDEVKESSGQVTVSLATGVGYTRATQSPATANINDNDILPILRIADATATTAGENIQFVVTASFQPTLPLIVNFQFDDNDAGFLADGQTSPQQLTFTSQRANLTLRTKRSETQESGTIDVSLRDEDTPTTYQVTSLFKRSAEGSVLNAVINKPTLSIEYISTQVTELEITEGSDARLQITANENPGTLTVSYTLSNVTGLFLSLTPDVPQTFRARFTGAGSVFSSLLIVETVAKDGIDTTAGRISVTLNETAEYEVNQSKSTISISVVNKPVLSIESISTSVNEGNTAEIRITSSKDPGTLSVSYTLRNVTGSYLSLTPDVPHTFSTGFKGQDSVYVATLTVETDGDGGNNSTGQISIELNQTVEYDVEPTKSITSFAIVNKPVLSIASILTKVNEGSFAQFRISSSKNPGTLSVSYTASNVTGSFLGQTPDVPLTFNASFTLENSVYVSTLVVRTVEISGVNSAGQISVALNRTVEYHVDQANRTATVVVEDTTVGVPVTPPPVTPPGNQVPEISISYLGISNLDTFDKGDTLTFVVSSSVGTSADLAIGLQIHQSDSFILWKIPNSITIDGGESSKRFTIPTHDPGISAANDGITVALLAGRGYTLDDNNKEVALTVSSTTSNAPTTLYSVVSSVISSILLEIPAHQSPPVLPVGTVPNVSVEATSESITEGESAIYVVRTDRTAKTPLSVKLEVTEEGSFIANTPTLYINVPAGETSVQYIVPTTDDEVAEPDGYIAVSIQEGSNYTTIPESVASIIVSDDGDRNVRLEQASYATGQILTTMVDAIGSRVHENSIDRMKLAFSGKDESFLNLNGQSSMQDFVQLAGDSLNEGTIDWQTLLSDSAFAINSNANGGTVWGASNTGGFSKTAIENVQIGTENLLFWQVGTDVKLGNELIIGLTGSATESEFNWRRTNQTKLHYDFHSSAFHPYFGWNQPDRNSQLFINAGVGEMQVRLKEIRSDTVDLEGNFQSLGISGEQSVYKTSMAADAFELKVEFDFMKSWLNADGSNYAFDSNTAAWWTESTLLGTHLRNFDGGASVNSLASVSVRRESSKSLDTVELIPHMGVQISSPEGITVDGHGSVNLLQDYDKNYGRLRMSIEFDRGQDNLGLKTGLSANWSHSLNSISEENRTGLNAINFTEFGEAGDSEIFNSHISYGVPIIGGNWTHTPFGRYSVYDDSFHEVKVGSRFEVSPTVGFEISGARSVKSGEVMDYEFQLDSDIRW